MGNSKYKWVICAGHGGMVDGKYTTAPKKMFVHPDGLTVYEGVFNRKVKDKLIKMLEDENINHVDIVPEEEDIPLAKRYHRALEEWKTDKNLIWVEIHGNAGKGTGFEVFTTVGKTNSDYIAEVFYEELKREFPEKTSRQDLTDGDHDKEANFYLIRKVPFPAILTENFFFDRYEDAVLMNSDEGQERVAIAHFEAIKLIEKLGIDGLKAKYSF